MRRSTKRRQINKRFNALAKVEAEKFAAREYVRHLKSVGKSDEEICIIIKDWDDRLIAQDW